MLSLTNGQIAALSNLDVAFTVQILEVHVARLRGDARHIRIDRFRCDITRFGLNVQFGALKSLAAHILVEQELVDMNRW